MGEIEYNRIITGDAIKELQNLPDNCLHSCATDPPYGISFMGQSWDRMEKQRRLSGCTGTGFADSVTAGKYDLTAKGMLVFHEFTRAWATEIYRVLRPGACLVSFASTRTYHRMVCGIEEAGFEIRDQLAWMFFSGFPKSHNLHDEWEGYGSALKPAYEPIVLARKPIEKGLSIRENMEKWGCGAINIDGCRIPGAWTFGTQTDIRGGNYNTNRPSEGHVHAKNIQSNPLGRWPANIIHDGSDEVESIFPQSDGQSGAVTGNEPSSKVNEIYNHFNGRPASLPRGDAGSSSRFFYCAKTSTSEREFGLENLEKGVGGFRSETSGQHITRRDGNAPGPRANIHPTVKPIALMRWLVRLITPAGGNCIDPFAGSGTTGIACNAEDIPWILIEREQKYIPIINARLAAYKPDPETGIIPMPPSDQLTIFDQL